MWVLKACRCCLQTSGKLARLTDQNIKLYHMVTGFEVTPADGFPTHICVECNTFLRKMMQFRRKSRRAHFVLNEIMIAKKQVTLKELNTIDRKQSNLETQLTVTGQEIINIPPTVTQNYTLNTSADTPNSIEQKQILNYNLPISNNTIISSNDVDINDAGSSIDRNSSINDVVKSKNVRTITIDGTISTNDDEMIVDDDVVCDYGNDDTMIVDDNGEEIDMEDIFKGLKEDNDYCLESEPEEIPLSPKREEKSLVAVKKLVKPKKTFKDYNYEDLYGKVHFTEKQILTKATKKTDALDKKLTNELKVKEEYDVREELDLEVSIEERAKDESYSKKTKPYKTKSKNTRKNREQNKKECKGTKFKFLTNEKVLNLFNITKLSLEEQIADLQRRKQSANYIKADFKCNNCFRGFNNQESFNTHLVRHTEEDGPFSCKVCNVHFKHPNIVYKHQAAHHFYRYNCKQCPLVTTQRQTAQMHLKWHSGISYKCPQCPEVFTKHTTYMSHLRKKHPSDFACELCGYSFVSSAGVYLHKRAKHRNDRRKVPENGPYCEPCDIRFVDEEAYHRHLRVLQKHSLHSATKEANEPKRFLKPKRVSNTDVDGTIDKTRTCEQCGITLDNQKTYYHHFRRMHPDKNRTKLPDCMFMCDQCGKMCPSAGALKDHARIHMSEMPFQCDFCDKRFKMMVQKKSHVMHVHTDKKFDCDQCDRKFSMKNNLIRHKYVHSGLKPLKCDLCDKRFTDTSTRNAHVKHEHLKMPYPKRKNPRKKKPPQKKSDLEEFNMDM